MAVSREQVFEVLQRVRPVLEQGLPGWSVCPNITGTGAVVLYLDGPELPLMGVNLAGEPVTVSVRNGSECRPWASRRAGSGAVSVYFGRERDRA